MPRRSEDAEQTPLHLPSAEPARPRPQRRPPRPQPPSAVDDVLAYVDSIGEPTGLVRWSGGGYLAVDAVTAVAPFEPGMLGLMDERLSATPSPARASYFKAAGRYVPKLLNLLQQEMEYEGPNPQDPAELGAYPG